MKSRLIARKTFRYESVRLALCLGVLFLLLFPLPSTTSAEPLLLITLILIGLLAADSIRNLLLHIKSIKNKNLVSCFDELDFTGSSLIKIEELLATLDKLILRELPKTQTTIFIWDEKTGYFIPYSVKGAGLENKPTRLRIFDPLIIWLGEQKSGFTYEEIMRCAVKNQFQANLETFLKKTQARYLYPVSVNQTLLCILSIRGGKVTNRQIKRFFDGSRSILTMLISNALLYDRITNLNTFLEDQVVERSQELSQAEKKIIEKEKLASLGTLVAGVAHEINNPAGVIAAGTKNLQVSFERVLFPQDSEDTKIKQLYEQFSKHTLTPNLNARQRYEKSKQLKESFVTTGNYDPIEASRRTSFLIDHGLENELDSISNLTSSEFDRLYSAIVLRRNFQSIEYATRQMISIVNALKRYVFSPGVKFDQVDLRDNLKQAILILKTKISNKTVFEENFSADLERIQGDSSELIQVWVNLIGNALDAVEEVDYTPKLAVSLNKVALLNRNISSKKIYYSFSELKESSNGEGPIFQKISIRDNGPGIDSEILKRIFDPFFSTKDQGKGSGMGLGISMNILQKHNALLAVESKQGETEFQVYLPQV